MRAALSAALLVVSASTTIVTTMAAAEDYAWQLPPGFPQPRVPESNPMSTEKVVLGQSLFFDTRLSSTGEYSCASCHRPELAFTDGRRTAIGATGQSHARNTPSILNGAYNASYGWADPDTRWLEDQHLIPMFNTQPVELGLTAERVPGLLVELQADPTIRDAFAAAYPEADTLVLEQVTGALASYVRSLIVADSPFDRYLYYDEDLLGDSAKRGVRLFFSERLACAVCHASFNLSGPVRWAQMPDADAVFHNTGLYNLDGTGRYPDAGLAAHTGRPDDMGGFRAPSLRNVSLTAPYMHDGSVASLEEVIDLYADGGRQIPSGPNAGDGRLNPFKREQISGFVLDHDERAALVAFLESLTSRSDF